MPASKETISQEQREKQKKLAEIMKTALELTLPTLEGGNPFKSVHQSLKQLSQDLSGDIAQPVKSVNLTKQDPITSDNSLTKQLKESATNNRQFRDYSKQLKELDIQGSTTDYSKIMNLLRQSTTALDASNAYQMGNDNYLKEFKRLEDRYKQVNDQLKESKNSRNNTKEVKGAVAKRDFDNDLRHFISRVDVACQAQAVSQQSSENKIFETLQQRKEDLEDSKGVLSQLSAAYSGKSEVQPYVLAGLSETLNRKGFAALQEEEKVRGKDLGCQQLQVDLKQLQDRHQALMLEKIDIDRLANLHQEESFELMPGGPQTTVSAVKASYEGKVKEFQEDVKVYTEKAIQTFDRCIERGENDLKFKENSSEPSHSLRALRK